MSFTLEALDLEPVHYALGREALEEIADKYDENGTSPKAYHNTAHTLDVVEATDLIAHARRVPYRQYGNLIIAAIFHDYEHDQSEFGVNESESVMAAVSAMSKTGKFTKEDYREVSDLIMSTLTQVARGRITQNVPSEYIPGMIIADADLSAFGRPPGAYWERALNLYQEYGGEITDNSALKKFAAAQVEILDKHRFFTTEAEELFPYRWENIAYTRLVAKG